jgi:hypothetical protein
VSYDLTPQQERKVNDRYASVAREFDRLKAAPTAFKDNIVVLQPDLLYCTIASWVIDEDRHIVFHRCTGLEIHKIMSYFTYWFSRIKPIQAMSAGEVSDPRIVMINEIFAQYYTCRMMDIKLSAVTSSRFYAEFVYMLRYRKFTAESIFSTMRFLEISAKNGTLSTY